MPGSASLRNTSERVIIFLLICACKTLVCLNVSGHISFIVPRSPVQVELESSEHLPRRTANQAAKHTACNEWVTCKSSRTTNQLMNVHFSSTALHGMTHSIKLKVQHTFWSIRSQREMGGEGLMGNCQQNRR